MYNPNIKLLVKMKDFTKNRAQAQFTLFKGAQLDSSIISPKELIKMHSGIFWEEPTIEERIQTQILKSVMGECTKDIIGKCTLEEAIKLIRALSHKQEIELVFH